MNIFKIKLVIFVIGIFFIFPLCTNATNTPYNASDLLGQINADGTVNYTTNAVNNNSINDTGMSQPSAVALDGVNHRLFVYDKRNNRVLVFNLNSDNTLTDHTADYVLGQLNFTSNTATTTQSGLGGGPALSNMSLQGALAYDSVNSRLFVSDMTNRRVLVFNVATSTIANGMNADYELGQPAGANAFTTSITVGATSMVSSGVSPGGPATQSGFSVPYGVAYDSTNTRLFVADVFNHRVMVFNVATSTMANGKDADYVLGQPDFTSTPASTTQSSILDPNLLNYDSVNDRLFVADGNNRRIMIFNVAPGTMTNGKNADYELGQPAGANAFTSRIEATSQTGLKDSVEDAVYDPINSRLFVSDANNHRIMVWDVSPSTMANGKAANYELGQPAGGTAFTTRNSATTQSGLKVPSGLAYDPVNSRLFVADSSNNRVMVFNVATSTIANGMNASDLLGQINLDGTVNWTSSMANISNNNIGLNNPFKTEVDTTNHRLFVADSNNNRVLVFNLNSDNTLTDHAADYVLGQPDFASYNANATQSRLSNPADLVYDSANSRLFVLDTNNNRIMIFNVATSTMVNGKDADYELGQPAGGTAFTSNTAATTQSRLSRPSGLAYDPANFRLFVSESNNHRITVFNVAPGTITNGEAADYELGQVAGGSAFTSSGGGLAKNRLTFPVGMNYDSANTRLFVADTLNNRVLVFNVATSTMVNGKDADYELGQPAGGTAFTSNTAATTQSGLNGPTGITYNPITNQLFVGESSNGRVTVFNVTPSTITNGMNASAVLGQTDFSSSVSTTTQSGLSTGFFTVYRSLTYDSTNNYLFVADAGNNRVILFNLINLSTTTFPTAMTTFSYSQSLTTSGSQGTVTFALNASSTLPAGISLNTNSGVISGTPTQAGVFSFSVTATDTVSPVAIFSDAETFSMNIVAPSIEAQITSFNFTNPSVTGIINNTDHTVTLTVPYGTDVTGLMPTIVISTGATVSPTSSTAGNFTNPQTYTVTAQDGVTQQAYIVTVIIENPVPVLNSISPLLKMAGDPQFTLTLNGSNFNSSSIAKFAGASLSTTYINSGQLTAIVPASNIIFAGTFNITVSNPTPGGGISDTLGFISNSGGGSPAIILQLPILSANSTSSFSGSNIIPIKITSNEIILQSGGTITSTSSITLPSAKFTTPLKKGMNNSDVKRLQQLLATDKEIYPEGLITGYFGILTEKAVQRFQLKYKVVSSSKDPGYGYVGPKTRAKLLEIFGK